MDEKTLPEQGPQLVPFPIYAEKARTAGELEKLATTDSLTGALNKEGLRRYMENVKGPIAFLLIDPTNFKAINDKYGYGAGDNVIVDTYELLRRSVRPEDVIARVGGDEYVIILNKESKPQANPGPVPRTISATPVEQIAAATSRIAQEVIDFLKARPELKAENFDLAVGGTVGTGSLDLQTLISQAEEPMKTQKEEQHQKGSYR